MPRSCVSVTHAKERPTQDSPSLTDVNLSVAGASRRRYGKIHIRSGLKGALTAQAFPNFDNHAVFVGKGSGGELGVK